MEKYVILFFTIILSLSLTNPAVSVFSIKLDDTIYVDDDNIYGPWDGSIDNPYVCLNDALKNAKTNSNIIVLEGSYDQNKIIYINKTVKISGIGADTDFYDSKFIICSNNVLIQNIKIGSIKLDNTYNCKLFNNTIISDNLKIELKQSSGNYIENNLIMTEDNSKPSIYLYESTNNVISKNTIYSGIYGLYLDFSNNNLIYENKICELSQSYSDSLIFLLSSDYNNITNNNLSKSSDSIKCRKSNNNNISNNEIYDCWCAIDISYCNNNIITNNKMINIEYGISVDNSCYNVFSYNTYYSDLGPVGLGLFDNSNNNFVEYNDFINIDCGVALGDSSNNVIRYNKFIRNNRYGISISSCNDNEIYYNIIEENGNKSYAYSGGIIFWGYYGKSTGNRIIFNIIIDNINTGINSSKSITDARFNYWGSKFGPSRTKLNLFGDRLTKEKSIVACFPWLLSPYDILNNI